MRCRFWPRIPSESHTALQGVTEEVKAHEIRTHTHTHTWIKRRDREEEKRRRRGRILRLRESPVIPTRRSTETRNSHCRLLLLLLLPAAPVDSTHTHRHTHTPDHLYPLIHNGVASLWMPINLTCKIFTWNLLDSRKKDGQKGKSFVTILNQLISFNLVHDWLVIQRGSNVTENFAFFHHVHSIQNLLKRIFKLIRNNRFFAPVDMI